MLSCSTCWNSGRHTQGGHMIKEITELGFERVELGHGIRLSLMEGVQRRFARGRAQFSSLHNFCPLPIEITRSAPDCYQFSSHRQSERERALKLTLQTIDFAARLEAPIVVLHLGSVPMRPITDELTRMIENGEHLSRAYVQAKIDAVKTREAKAPLYLERVKECLKPILDHAIAKNVRLGVEGRYSYEEIPTEREAVAILEEFDSPNLGYWHDFGHIQTKHNLGFLDHFEWLSAIRGRLLGAHLHDCEWPATDHRAPFTGMIDYDRLVPLFPENATFVWEMSPRRKAEEIVESLSRWKERFGG